MKVRNQSKKHIVLIASVIIALVISMSAATVSVFAASAPTGEVLANYQVSMSGEINLRFIYESLGNAAEYVAEVYAPNTEKPKYTYTYPVNEITEKTGSSGKTYTVSVPLAPSEMTYTVKVYPRSAGGIAGKVKECSIVSYANAVIEQFPTHADTMRAMLNWGAYAQQYFNNTSPDAVKELANYGIFARGTNPVSAVTSIPFQSHGTLSIGGKSFSNGTMNLALKPNNIALNIYVDYSGVGTPTATIQRDAVGDKIPEVNKTLTAKKADATGTKYVISINNISAPLFNSLYTITFNGEDSEGNPQTFKAQTSVLEYLNGMVTGAGYTDAQKNTARSLYQFYQLATDNTGADACAHYDTAAKTNNENIDYYWIANDAGSSFYKCSHCFTQLGGAVNNNVEKYMPAELIAKIGDEKGTVSRTLSSDKSYVTLGGFAVNDEDYFGLKLFSSGNAVTGRYLVMKVKMSGPNTTLGVYAATGGNAVVGGSCANVKIETDNSWHTVVVDMAARTGIWANETMAFLELRPFNGAQASVDSNNYIDIAYIATCDNIDDLGYIAAGESTYEYSISDTKSLTYAGPASTCKHTDTVTQNDVETVNNTELYTYSCSACNAVVASHSVSTDINYYSDLKSMDIYGGNNGSISSIKVDTNGVAYRTYSQPNAAGEHFNLTGGTGSGKKTGDPYYIGDYLVIKYRRVENASVGSANQLSLVVGNNNIADEVQNSEGKKEPNPNRSTEETAFSGPACSTIPTEWQVVVLDISELDYWRDSNNKPISNPIYVMMNPNGALTLDVAYIASIDSLDELKGLVTNENVVFKSAWSAGGIEMDMSSTVTAHITPTQMIKVTNNVNKTEKWEPSNPFYMNDEAIEIEKGVKYFTFGVDADKNVAQFIWNRDKSAITNTANNYNDDELYTSNVGRARYFVMKARVSNGASKATPDITMKAFISTTGNDRQSFVVPLTALYSGNWGIYVADLQSLLTEAYKPLADGTYEIDTFYLHMEPFADDVKVDIEYMAFVEDDWKNLPMLPVTGNVVMIADLEGNYSRISIADGRCFDGCKFSTDGTYTCTVCGYAPECKGIHDITITETTHYRADCTYCGHEGITYGSHDREECTVCGYSGNICEHPEGQLTVNKEPISGDVKHIYTCGTCGEVAYEYIEYCADSHKYVSDGANGHHTEACDVCGAGEGAIEPHDYVIMTQKLDTTTTYVIKCTVCGYENANYEEDSTMPEGVVRYYDAIQLSSAPKTNFQITQNGVIDDFKTGKSYASYNGQDPETAKTMQIIYTRTGYSSDPADKNNFYPNVGAAKYFVIRLRVSEGHPEFELHISTAASGKETIVLPTRVAGTDWATYIIDLTKIVGSSHYSPTNGAYILKTLYFESKGLVSANAFDIEFMAFTEDKDSAIKIAGDLSYIDMTETATPTQKTDIPTQSTGEGADRAPVAETVTGAELLTILANKNGNAGAIEGDTYTVDGDLTLSDDDARYYGNGATVNVSGNIIIENVSNVLLKDIVLNGNVVIRGTSENITFFNVDINAGDENAFSIESECRSINIENCRITTKETAISSSADNVTLSYGKVSAKVGVVSDGNDLAVNGTVLNVESSAVTSSGEYAVIKGNDITVSDNAVAILLKSGSENSLVAQNTVKGTHNSISISNAFNCSVVLNDAVSITAENNKNIYIIENTVSNITVKNNNYLICDANKTDREYELGVVNIGNKNYNGDTLQDLTVRAEHGANEDLLPHTNKDLFIGMEKRTSVNDPAATKTYDLNSYVSAMASNKDVVIVPPGAYTVSSALELGNGQKDTKVYAYGVYQEKTPVKNTTTGNIDGTDKGRFAKQLGTVLSITGANISVKGLTVGYDFQSSGQVYALEKYSEGGKYYVKVITAAGYINGFSTADPTSFQNTVSMTKGDALFPWANSVDHSMVQNSDGTYFDKDGIMTIELKNKDQYDRVEPGDIFGCRLAGDNATSVGINGINTYLEDCVIYGYSAALAMVSSGRNAINVQLERVHNTSRPAPVIDEATYNKYIELEVKYGLKSDGNDPTGGQGLEVYSYEENGNTVYRGALPRYGSVDATHINGAAQGTSATSCLFENMVDDGSNQRYSSARIAGMVVDGTTTTLYHKGSLASTYYNIDTGAYKKTATPTGSGLTFNAGDRIFAYASNGYTLIDANVESGSTLAGTLPAGVHIVHTDSDNDCICDYAACQAKMHIDHYINNSTTIKRDCLCDKCGMVVHTDHGRHNLGTGEGDGVCNVCKQSLSGYEGYIITDMTNNASYDPDKSELTYEVFVSDGYIIKYTTKIYKVTVKTVDVNPEAASGYDFADNECFMEEKIMCDNLSINSVGFTFDNVLMQNYHSRGILMKTTDSTVKNCTFRNIGSTGMLLSIEPTWGESTVPKNIAIESCLFDNTGAGYNYASTKTYAPIAIQGLGNAPDMLAGVSADTLPAKDIRILNNKFINTNNNYCITIGQAQGITIEGNIFEVKNHGENKDLGKAISIEESMNITVSGNDFASGAVADMIDGVRYRNLNGSDIKADDFTQNSCGATHVTSSDASTHTIAACDECGAIAATDKPHTETWVKGANGHSKICAECLYVISEEAGHSFSDGVCTECGYECKHAAEVWGSDADGHTRLCSDCDKVIIAKEGHTWSDGVCTECEYQCKHTTAKWTTTETKHSKTCPDCKKIIVAEEAHEWKGDNKCDKCEYICEHPNKSWTKDAEGHKETCSICATVTIDKQPHNYNSNGICDTCEYVCQHSEIAKTWQSNGAEGHKEICAACQITIAENEVHDTTGEGGKCSKCEYLACQHENKTWVANNANTHSQVCDDCRTVVIEEQAHSWSAEDICTQCGQTRTYHYVDETDKWEGPIVNKK